MADAGLRITGLEKSYGDRRVLRGVDLRVEPGEIVGLLGPNGAGKTTLTSISAGLRSPDAGRVEVCGVEVARDPDRARRHLGLAPQELGIYPLLPVRTNLEYLARIGGMRGRALRERVAEVAGALALTELLPRRAATLSGGQKRRLHAAMALVHRPQVLFLDEPTVGADVETRQQLLAVVGDLADSGVAVVYCTHYLPEVEQLRARVAVLASGRIAAEGTVRELVDTYAEATVELVVDGEPPPGLPGVRRPDPAGGGVRVSITTTEPEASVTAALTALGPALASLRSVEIRRASLETAYLSLLAAAGNPPPARGSVGGTASGPATDAVIDAAPEVAHDAVA